MQAVRGGEMVKTTADFVLLMAGVAFILAIGHTRSMSDLMICYVMAIIYFTGPLVSIGQVFWSALLHKR